MPERQPAHKQGIVITKKHPNLRFGQLVFIIEETEDLYRVKAQSNQLPYIISKTDIKLQ